MINVPMKLQMNASLSKSIGLTCPLPLALKARPIDIKKHIQIYQKDQIGLYNANANVYEMHFTSLRTINVQNGIHIN